ncbi:MAG: CapA family protein, partial [Solobacterium sp.]|nr:CapA family protein [Solobacterium sp.]
MAKRKRHLRRSVKIILCLIPVIALLLFFLPKGSKEPEQTAAETPLPPTPVPSETPEPQPQVYTASLYMLGDALPQRMILKEAKTDTGYDFSSQADGITNIAKNYDLAYYNQEVILGGDDLGFTIWPHMNAPRAFGEYMISKGFNLVSNANNHSLDKDLQGVLNSCAFWAEHPEVVTAGLNLSQEDREAVPVHEKNGITYAFTSWTYGMNMYSQPKGREYTVNCYRGHEQEMLNWVTRAKQLADVVIVAIHWGQEYHFEPNEEQKKLAQQLADAGADIIIGNHP